MTDITQRLAESFATIDCLRAMSHDPSLPWPVSRGLEITDALIAHFDDARALFDKAFAAMPAEPVLRIPLKVTMSDINPDLFTQTFIERRPHPTFFGDASISPHNQYLYRVVGIPAPGIGEELDARHEYRSTPITQFEGYEYPDIISAICSWRISIFPGNPLGFCNLRVDKTKDIHLATNEIRANLAQSVIYSTHHQKRGEHLANIRSRVIGCLVDIVDHISREMAACALWLYPLPGWYPLPGRLTNFEEFAVIHLPGLDWRPLYAFLCACRVNLHSTPPASLGEFLRPFWDIGMHQLSFFDVRFPGEPEHFSPRDAITHAIMQGSRADNFRDLIDIAVYQHMLLPEIGQPTPPLIFRLDADILASQRFFDKLEAEEAQAAIDAEMAMMRD
jgi:hypothetical protein